MDVKKLLNLEPRTRDFVSRLEPKLGLIEYTANGKASTDFMSILLDYKMIQDGIELEENKHHMHSKDLYKFPLPKKLKVAVVGRGPLGLFASLVLGEHGVEVTLIERGQAVEQRGRDNCALLVRRVLQS